MTTKQKSDSSGRARPVYVSLDELSKACGSCGHQNGGHIGGAARSGWPIYDPIWATGGGRCTFPECPCAGRTSDPAARTAPTVPEAPAVVVPPPPIATALTGPCGYGTGPCGATPTRPFAEGSRCATHAPTAITGGVAATSTASNSMAAFATPSLTSHRSTCSASRNKSKGPGVPVRRWMA